MRSNCARQDKVPADGVSGTPWMRRGYIFLCPCSCSSCKWSQLLRSIVVLCPRAVMKHPGDVPRAHNARSDPTCLPLVFRRDKLWAS